MKQYRVLIIDDELLARTLLTEYIYRIPDLVLAGSYSNAVDAMQLLQNNEVDIVLTDIEMPDMNGMDFAKIIQRKVAVIFTTAYSRYAVEGFSLDAIDYLLKPIAFPRFVQAIQKAIAWVDNLSNTKNYTEKSPIDADFIHVKADHKVYRINLNELYRVEGMSEYVKFYTARGNITALYALKKLEEQLPASRFMRVHKSHIISLQHVEYIGNNSLRVAGQNIPIGLTYHEKIEAFFFS
ncbi:MAG: LytTR family DNA-binding domain-containing protein [Bacteroidales bacterium]|jgi:DNA-binding LytR/AlgR family response regulator|nr:LytTR family DNA-binding domain-containing protein [Bacteroidales bacterium]